MAIVGSINSGLTGDNTTLNIKAILDGTISNKLKQFKEKISQTGLKR